MTERPKSPFEKFLLWVAGGFTAGVAFAITMFLLDHNKEMGRLSAMPAEMEQYQRRFSSDIEQHDKRIENNGANIRTILRMLEGRDE